MRNIFYLLLFFSAVGYSQNVELLVDKLAYDMLPEHFESYLLIEESLNDKKANDSITIKYPITKWEFDKKYNDFPYKQLCYPVENKKVNWKNYHLEKAKYITKEDAEKVERYYSFSNPVFSKDKKYARITVLERTKGRGTYITYLYKFENQGWKQIGESNQYVIVNSYYD